MDIREPGSGICLGALSSLVIPEMSTRCMKKIPQTWDSPALSLVGLHSLWKKSQSRSLYQSKSSSNKTSRKEQETMKGTPLEGCFLPTLFIEENRNQNHNTRACLPSWPGCIFSDDLLKRGWWKWVIHDSYRQGQPSSVQPATLGLFLLTSWLALSHGSISSWCPAGLKSKCADHMLGERQLSWKSPFKIFKVNHNFLIQICHFPTPASMDIHINKYHTVFLYYL